MDRLYAGEVGYLAASIKAVADARVGDTITLRKACRTALSSVWRLTAASGPCALGSGQAAAVRPCAWQALGSIPMQQTGLNCQPSALTWHSICDVSEVLGGYSAVA